MAARSQLLLTFFLAVSRASAQAEYGNASSEATPPPTGIVFPDPTGVSTRYISRSYNSSLASTRLPNNDYSDEQLAFLWDQVGPIAMGPVTTTVSPTPEPSAYASPDDSLHPYIPSYFSNLAGVSLPEGFTWGVASSSFQIEASTTLSRCHFCLG